MDALEIGAKVQRCNSPKDTLILDGNRGVIREVLQADNGELGYIVLFPAQALRDAKPGTEGHVPVFCAGSRLVRVMAADSTTP
jgi:hypothetical protein